MAGWAPQGKTVTVRVDPGRAHTAFYGTLDLKTGAVVVTESTQMNAAATVAHLEAVLARYPDVPILLLWDRAPWHQGAALRTFLADHPRLEIIRLPTAAPDLNPQEHVWRAARRKVCHNHTERRLPGLAERFMQYLTNATFPSSFLKRYGWYLVCPGFT